MKQYKLIKEYPASPSLGHIVTEDEEGRYGPFEVNSLSHIDIEESPEYWREVLFKATYGQHICVGEQLWWMRIKPTCESCTCENSNEVLYQYGSVHWENNTAEEIVKINGDEYIFFTSKEECERFLNTPQFSIRDVQITYALVNAEYNLQEFFNRLFHGDK